MTVANSKPGFLVLFVFCLSVPTGSWGNIEKHVALFVFGDSLYDPGNNNYINTTLSFQANFWPYGESYFNPPTGRFSNGRIIPDFIAEYAGLPLIPPYLEPENNEFSYGANFASGGAGVLIDINAGFVVDLQTQLRYLGDVESKHRENLGNTGARQLLSSAVYLFNIGSNDYGTFVDNNLSIYHLFTNEQYTDMVVGNLTNVIKGIYAKGGRKFGFLMLPLMGCLPGLRITQPGYICYKAINDIARLHNQKLARKLEHLEKQLEGFMYSYFDISTAVTNRMNNPSKYGFKDGETACCGGGPFRGNYACGGMRGIKEYELCDNATEYLFFDSVHPNELANRQLSEMFWEGDSQVTGPYNLQALFKGSEEEQGLVVIARLGVE